MNRNYSLYIISRCSVRLLSNAIILEAERTNFDYVLLPQMRASSHLPASTSSTLGKVASQSHPSVSKENDIKIAHNLNENLTSPILSPTQSESSWISSLPYQLLTGIANLQEASEVDHTQRTRTDRYQACDRILSGGHTCNICGRWFQNGVHLTRHHLVHTGEKPFKCQHCSYESNQKSALNRHFRSIHLGIKKPIQDLTEEEKRFYQIN